MITVSVSEARENLSDLLGKVQHGRGRPQAPPRSAARPVPRSRTRSTPRSDAPRPRARSRAVGVRLGGTDDRRAGSGCEPGARSKRTQVDSRRPSDAPLYPSREQVVFAYNLQNQITTGHCLEYGRIIRPRWRRRWDACQSRLRGQTTCHGPFPSPRRSKPSAR